MQIGITARRVKLSEQFKVLVNEKLARLARYASKIEEARAIFSLERFNYITEIALTGKRIRIAASGKDRDMRASFDEAVMSLEKRLKKFRGKIKEHNSNNKEQAQIDEFALKKLNEETPAPRIIKTDILVKKPMLPEDAAAELDLFNKEFLVFINSDNDKVNILYRRKDGDYGLIEP